MSFTSTGDGTLALVHQGWNHLKLQRPLAAWAAWQRALRLEPDDQAARQALEHLASTEDLPTAARTVYKFRTPAGDDRRARWDCCLQGRDWFDLAIAADTFRELAANDPCDVAALYNYALCLAWKGANAPAVATLERVVKLEAGVFPESAAATWALAEILRQGAGAEHLADDFSHAASVAWQSGDPDPASLGELRAVALPNDPEPGRTHFKDVRAFEWLERPLPSPDSSLSLADLPRILAVVIQTPRSLRLSSPDPQGLGTALDRLAQCLADSARPIRREATPLPLPLMDAAVWTFRLPDGLDDEARQRLTRSAIENYYENVWIHSPRHGLEGRSPLEASEAAAAGDPAARAELTGLIQIREQLAARPRMAELYKGYPFDRLRCRLGLELHDLQAVDPGDYGCMSGTQLDSLDAVDLDDFALAEAYESAAGLGDDARTAQFAAALVGRTPGTLCRTHVDPARLFAALVRYSMAQDDSEQALAWLDRALALDGDSEGGGRRRTYDIWRAEVHARSGAPDSATRIYQSILERHPTDALLALDAATTLLDCGYPDHSLSLAQQARELARLAGDAVTQARVESLLERTE